MNYRAKAHTLESVDGERFIWLWHPHEDPCETCYICEAKAGLSAEEIEEQSAFEVIGACRDCDESRAIYLMAMELVAEGEVERRSLLSFFRQVTRCCRRLEIAVEKEVSEDEKN
jgi:hypothetical protein